MPLPFSRLLTSWAAGTLVMAGCGGPPPKRQVWFAPNMGSADMIELFTRPQQWPSARRSTDVFKFYERQLVADTPAECPECGRNIFPELARVDAFTRLSAWGVGIGIEVGVVKSWGCDASATLPLAMEAVRRVEARRAVVTDLAMDEPLLGAESCQLTLDEAARHAAVFARGAREGRSHLRVGDIEPYPLYSVSTLLEWVGALRENGFTPAFLHLDVDRAYAGRIAADVPGDLVTLRTSLEAQGIPFGVIFWSEEGSSDEAYSADVLAWVETVRMAVGEPSHSVFQSWAVSADGRLGVPPNLPEDDAAVHTHTRLVDEALAALRGRAPRSRAR
jgi:hypothetical protein